MNQQHSHQSYQINHERQNVPMKPLPFSEKALTAMKFAENKPKSFSYGSKESLIKGDKEWIIAQNHEQLQQK